jgi:hypothetical protein
MRGKPRISLRFIRATSLLRHNLRHLAFVGRVSFHGGNGGR